MRPLRVSKPAVVRTRYQCSSAATQSVVAACSRSGPGNPETVRSSPPLPSCLVGHHVLSADNGVDQHSAGSRKQTTEQTQGFNTGGWLSNHSAEAAWSALAWTVGPNCSLLHARCHRHISPGWPLSSRIPSAFSDAARTYSCTYCRRQASCQPTSGLSACASHVTS